MNKLAINNPKRLSDNGSKVNWYTYYAGFSSLFVKNILLSLEMDKNSIVLDPWNGAGTTTFSAAREGIMSIGIDLNPVMSIIAKAKCASEIDVDLAIGRLRCLRLNKFSVDFEKTDYLCNWFVDDTAKYIRYVSRAIGNKKTEPDELTVSQCVMFLALFNVVRDTLKVFIPSNPTWIKKAKSDDSKLSLDNIIIKKNILAYLNRIKSEASLHDRDWVTKIICASSTEMPIEGCSIDLIVTSPPYCTRIDYGVATYPELAILLGDRPSLVDTIRRKLIGRTTIDKNHSQYEFISDKSVAFMSLVERHISHASSGYYLKNFRQYFIDMQESIFEVSRVLKKGAPFVCVVQDSYYKDIYCDLSGIMEEIALKNGLVLLRKENFKVKSVMANIHSGTKKYRSKVSAIESVLIFEKL